MTEYKAEKQSELFVKELELPIEYIVNILVKYLKDRAIKDTLWKLFGEQIYTNIQNNLQGTKICEVCGERFEVNGSKDRNIYCENCKYEKYIEKNEKYNKKRTNI